MNNAPIKRNVGDKVVLTQSSFQNIVNSNRSIHAYPCDSFVEKIRAHIGQTGTVTHTWDVGYEAAIEFNGQAFHMKDHWVESL